MNRFLRSLLHAPKRSQPQNKHSIWTVSPFLLAVTMLGRPSQIIAQTTYPLIGHELLGLDNSTIGLIAAVSGFAGILSSALVVPRIATRSLLWFLVLSQILWLSAFVLFATSSQSIEIWIGAIAIGIGGGLFFPTLMTTIGMSKQTEQAKALALFALALSASLLVGPLLEAGILHLLHNSLRTAFALSLPLPAAATVSAVATAMRARSSITGSNRNVSRRPSNKEIGKPSAFFASANLSRSSFWIAFHTMLMYQAPSTALVVFGGLLARYRVHASTTNIEFAFGVFFGVSLVVRAFLTIWPPVSKRTAVLVASALATVTGVAVLATASGLPALFLAMAILGAPHGTTFPLASSILAETTPRKGLARANGILMACDNAVAVIVPFVCGWLIEAVGYRSTFLLLEVPVVGFASLLVFHLFRTPRKSIPATASMGDNGPQHSFQLPG